jgi:hypothetical protein
MKSDGKGRKSGVSPFSKMNVKTVNADKSSKRLIERVEKAISQQGHLHSSK